MHGTAGCAIGFSTTGLKTDRLYPVMLSTHPFNGPLSGTTRVSRYRKGETNLDFSEARDSEWQWHQLGHMQVCTSLQTDNHASTHHSEFFYRPDALPAATNSVKALKALYPVMLKRPNFQNLRPRPIFWPRCRHFGQHVEIETRALKPTRQ